MNLNTGYFAAYNHRRKQANVGYRSPCTAFSKTTRSSSENTNYSESFLPSITTNNGGQDGHRPYRRNDFANNHLFVAKQKLARIFLDQPTMSIQAKSELIHLFDKHEPKQKYRRINKNKRQENNFDSKSSSSTDQDLHLSVVNLIMKPSLPSPQINSPLAAISYRRQQGSHSKAKTPRSSIEWINPAMNQHIQSISRHSIDDDLDSNTIITELRDHNPGMINSTSNPLDLSVLYVKSILTSTGKQQR